MIFIPQRGPTEDLDPRAPGLFRRSWQRFATSRGTLVFSILFLSLLVLAGVYAALLPTPSNSEPDTLTAPSQELPAELPVAAQPDLALCPEQARQDVAPETLVLTAYDTQWAPTGAVLLPSSAAAAPLNAGAIPACYPRSPEGALYSAGEFYLLSGAASSATENIAIVQARASRTGAYQQLMTQLQANPASAEPTGSVPPTQVIGYRWLGYTPDLAQVEIQFLWTGGSRAGQTFAVTQQLVWESNDWLVVVPNPNTQIHLPPSTDIIYTPWGPPL